MIKRLFTTALVSAAAASGALAYEGEASIPQELSEILEMMPEAANVDSVSLFDMSSNGRPEALVRLKDNCEHGSCRWILFAELDDGWRAVGNGLARSVRFEPTQTSGAVVNADDVTYAYSGGSEIYMWGDLLQGSQPRAASDEEYRLVARSTPYTETAQMQLETYEVDLNGDGSAERIFLVGGLLYQVGMWGTPFAIFAGDDSVVMTGVSSDLPRIFPMSDAPGSLVLSVMPAGLQVAEIK